MQLKVVVIFNQGLQDIDKVQSLYLNQYSTKLLGVSNNCITDIQI